MSEMRDVQRWFTRRGFSSLLEGTAMTRNPATQARLLALLLLVSMLTTMSWDAGVPVAPIAVNLVILVLAWVGLNLAARRRPLSPPRSVTWRERTVFVLAPAVASLLAPVQNVTVEEVTLDAVSLRLLAVGVQILIQSVLLWIASAFIRSGLVAVFPWLGRQMALALWSAGSALGRTVPLLLGVIALIFFTGEIWQSVGRLAGWGYALVLGLFFLLSWMFLHSREHLDLLGLSTFDDRAEVVDLLADTPLALDEGERLDLPARTPLAAHHISDLRLVAVIARITVTVVISLGVFAFFVTLGVLAINADTVRAWITADPSVLVSLYTARHRYDLTAEHLRVAGFMAVFAGLYFAVASRTDAHLRAGMRDTAEEEIREACAARLVALSRYPGSTSPARG